MDVIQKERYSERMLFRKNVIQKECYSERMLFIRDVIQNILKMKSLFFFSAPRRAEAVSPAMQEKTTGDNRKIHVDLKRKQFLSKNAPLDRE